MGDEDECDDYGENDDEKVMGDEDESDDDGE